MRTTLITCDRCGRKSTDVPADAWYDQIKAVYVKCPPDGVNQGEYRPDLCGNCRTQLDSIVKQFLKGVLT